MKDKTGKFDAPLIKNGYMVSMIAENVYFLHSKKRQLLIIAKSTAKI